MALQSSGAISLSNVGVTFGQSFRNLGALYSVAAGVPSTGTISLSNMYGKNASTPSISSISTSNVSTNSSSQSGTINLTSFITDVYGAPFSYAAPSYSSSFFSSASMSSSSLSFGIPQNKFANTTSVSVVVTNRFGRTATISVPFKITGYNIGSSSLGSRSLTNNTATISLGSYFTDYSGAGLSYSLTTNPYSNASISGSTLYVYANYRNTSYTVTVQATNSYGQVSSASLSVTEGLSPPSASSMGSTSTLRTSTVSYYLYSYFSGTITSFSITSNPYSSASISGSYLYIYPNNRNTSYYVTVTAYNSGGSASASLYVTEGVAAPTASSMGSTSTLTNNTVTYYLYSYFGGQLDSWSVTSNPYSNAYISGGYLYVPANYRNTNYTVTVTAYNSGGSASSSLTVYEGSSGPVCANCAGTYYWTYWNNNIAGAGTTGATITMNTTTGYGTINNGDGNNNTIYNTSFYQFYVPVWNLYGTYNGSDTIAWANASTWKKFYNELTGWWNGYNNYISTSSLAGSGTMSGRPNFTITVINYAQRQLSFYFPDDRTYTVTVNGDSTVLTFSGGGTWTKV